MAKIKLKVAGSPQIATFSEGTSITVENIAELVQRQRQIDNYEYTYSIFLNGVMVDEPLKRLRDGDEVILIPIAAGG